MLGLSPGAEIVTWTNVKFLHPSTFMWNCLLSFEVMSFTMLLVMKLNLRLCLFH